MTRARQAILAAALALAATAGRAEPAAATNLVTGLFSLRSGLPCHTATYAPRRLLWSQVPGPEGLLAVYPHPAAAATVYAATPDGLYRSDDFAGTWRRVPLAGAPGPVVDLAFRPGEPETLCFGTRANGVWLSEDGGRTARRVGSKATGMASDSVQSLIYAAGDTLRRSVLVSHGAAAPGLSRCDTRDGRSTVVAAALCVYRMAPASRRGRDFYAFAAEATTPDAIGVYYASTLGAYWQRAIADAMPTDAAWFDPVGGLYVTTWDRGVLRLSEGAAVRRRLGGEDSEWLGVGATWGAHADAPAVYLYQPRARGLVWTTNDLAGAVDQGSGLYRGSFVTEGSRIRPNAGGTRFYGAVSGKLWIGRDAGPFRVDTIAMTPSSVTVTAAAMGDGFWKAMDMPLHEFNTASRASRSADRLAAVLRELNGAVSAGEVTVAARIVAPPGAVPEVTADLSRFGSSPETPMTMGTNGAYETRFRLTSETLTRMGNRNKDEWRDTWPGPMPVTVSARAPGRAPAGAVGLFALHTRPEVLAFGRDHWALHLGGAEGPVAFKCERFNEKEYWVPLHQKLTVGPGPWRAPIWHINIAANIAEYEAMTFLLRSEGPGGGDLAVQLCDRPVDEASSTTAEVRLVAGGFVEGGAIATEYRRVTVPVAALLKEAKGFRPDLFAGVVFSGVSETNRTYLIDDWRFVVSKHDMPPGAGGTP